MHYRGSVFLAVLILGFVIFGGCTSSVPTIPVSPSEPVARQLPPTDKAVAFTLKAASLMPGSVLPDVYTCKGASESPGVAWEGVPSGTKSLVLILDDPDSPDEGFTHWLVFNIPPDSEGLPRAQPNTKVLSNGAQQGENSGGSRGYYPPCPPIGTIHRYIFRLYAVDMDITMPTAGRDSIDRALTGHTIAKTEFITTFKQ